ncbi:uncharacterized protein LOC129608168 [Condylostylus longicornis]|uniref:uncharacterized protein LOC129608168 n=1 Tax=Condylostylus longicornis TaxID=2530218 RepID=UPI00244E157D|nr:uncharacterized protein LOC129608168 [Condylostylus longicornis]
MTEYYIGTAETNEDSFESSVYSSESNINQDSESLYLILKDQNILENYLNCTEGRVITNFFNKYNNLRGLQSSLANLIIEKELDQEKISDLKITSDRLLYLAKSIEEYFSSEKSDDYYVPYNNERKSLATGKLWTAYNKFKLKVRKSVTISSRNATSVITSKTDAEKINFLKCNLSPWETVVSFWIDTAKERIQTLNSSTNNNVLKYFEEYPPLKSPKGILLLEKDFEHLYKDNYENFFSAWNNINEKLIKISENKVEKNPEYKVILNQGKGELTGLFLLPYLLHNNFGKKRNAAGETLRLSKTEKAESFILQVFDAINLNVEREQIRNRLRHKDSLQPYVIFVGKNNTQAYVDIDGNLYNVDSPLKAIDLCFKVFHATNIAYPADAEVIWTFIQKAIYKINTKSDKFFISVNKLMMVLWIAIILRIKDLKF